MLPVEDVVSFFFLPRARARDDDDAATAATARRAPPSSLTGRVRVGVRRHAGGADVARVGQGRALPRQGALREEPAQPVVVLPGRQRPLGVQVDDPRVVVVVVVVVVVAPRFRRPAVVPQGAQGRALGARRAVRHVEGGAVAGPRPRRPVPDRGDGHVRVVQGGVQRAQLLQEHGRHPALVLRTPHEQVVEDLHPRDDIASMLRPGCCCCGRIAPWGGGQQGVLGHKCPDKERGHHGSAGVAGRRWQQWRRTHRSRACGLGCVVF